MKKNILKLHKGVITKSSEPDAGSKRRERDRQFFNKVMADASDLGFSIVLPMVGGIFIGRLIDTRFDTSPTWTLSLLFLGVIIAAIRIIRLLREDT